MHANSGMNKVGLNDNSSVLRWVLILAIVISAVIMFTKIFHYPLWDDEAIDALVGKGIFQTGDTSGVIGHNILGYRNGLLLNRLRVEGEPPFTAFAAACSMRFFGTTSWAARLPVALLAFAGVLLLLWWIWKLRPPLTFVLIFVIGLISNASLYLYSRQCHYYGIAIFSFIAIPFLYLNWSGRNPMLLLMGLCSAVLLASNYTFFLVLYTCLFADYIIWQRKVRGFSLAELCLIAIPPFLTGLALMAWWNPFHTMMGARIAHDSISQRITLFLWHWRDLNRCEMIVGALLLIAPLVAFICRDTWLKRALFALVIYVVGMTILSTQSISETSVSDVRYFSGLIPLFIFIEALTIRDLTRKATWLAIPLALVAFGTNLLNGGSLQSCGFRSTIVSYVGELVKPPQDPYKPAAEWIRNNVPKDSSIWVLPDYMTYPLMFHAPDAVYAWQLRSDQKKEEQFKDLPDIHFQGLVSPDYIVVFGPSVIQIRELLQRWKSMGVQYDEIYRINTFWKDLYRPELFWRTFKPIKEFDPETQAIYFFKKKKTDNQNK